MKNGEILDTDSRRELVMHYPVEHRSDEATGSDFKSFHRGISTGRIVAVDKSLYRSLSRARTQEKVPKPSARVYPSRRIQS
jgi:hypothetical protein